MTSAYIELHAHSAFSFLDGASTPTELAGAAARLGYETFALTDHDGLWGSMEFAHAAKGLDLRPITGAELSVMTDGRASPAHVTLLVEDATGYANLCRILTVAHSHTRAGRTRELGPAWVNLEALEAHAKGLLCLSGCARDGLLAGAFEDRPRRPAAIEAARRLIAAFGRDRFRVELQRPFWRHDRARNRWLRQVADRLGVPCVATGDVHSHDSRRGYLQDALVSIGLNMPLEASEPMRRGNRSSALSSPDAMVARFAEHPEAVGETIRVAERLTFDLTTDLGYRYPGAEDPGADRELTEACGRLLADRYAGSPHRAEAEARLDEELAVIRGLKLSGFFLLHRDMLELAREVAVEVRGPDSVRALMPPGRGRGSSVSSIVCFLTGLSHVDPVKAGLFSGRFLSEESTSMPDIDLDFPRDIREVLIPRVHERYGREHSALVAAFPTYRPKGAVRDVGKALGLPPEEIDRVAKTFGYHGDAGEFEAQLRATLGTERASSHRWRVLARLAPQIMGLPRHASQHSGGMVISTRPLVEMCPVVPAAMVGRQIVQWDKDSCADAGMLKIDLLGLGMLSAVERAVVEIEQVRGKRVDLSRIDLQDEETFTAIRAAKTTGVFQIESRAQMQMLPRTQPRNLEDLTVQVALVRPGPIQGGAIHPYIERRAKLREDPGYRVPYEHPLLEPVLGETLGTIVYQEQVLEVAIALAGFTAGEAEGLRRAMSRKRSQEAIDAHRERFIAGAGENWVPVATARRVWEQIEGFAGFGFPKAHSAAFGLLAYQSAFLQVHYAPEFLAALLNEQPMGFYPPDALVGEARRRGVNVVAPEVNRSEVLCRVERLQGGLAVRIGLGYVKGAKEEEMRSLVAAREYAGDYGGIADLASRSGVGRHGLELLAWAGTLDALPGDGRRRERLWGVGVAGASRAQAPRAQQVLPIEPPAPPALEPLGDWQESVENYRATGINLGRHPMAMLRPHLGPDVVPSSRLPVLADRSEVEVAGMVIARQRPESAKGVTFLLLEDECGTVNLIVGRAVYERSRTVVRSAPLVRARGRLEHREGAINVVVANISELRQSERNMNGSGVGNTGEPSARKRARERAIAELRAVVPAGHAFGRRGG